MLKRWIPVRVKEFVKQTRASLVHRHQLRDAAGRVLPDFLIVGAQKCGTTSLHGQLIQHPLIASSTVKEVHYFDLNYGEGIEWYRAHFPLASQVKQRPWHDGSVFRQLTGEASPYYIYHPYAMERIAEDLPGVKIVVMLRHPVDRAYSSYHHQVRKGRETETFETAIELEAERLAADLAALELNPLHEGLAHMYYSYLDRSRYYPQMRHILQLFPSSDVLVVESSEYYTQTDLVYQQVLDFLELPAIPTPPQENVAKFPYPPMRESTRQRLTGEFAPLNEQLFELIERRFDWR
ncbi:MAG: sulfotransferase domain-containing protein [Pirellulaceae bacterium]|nr:sulfotransferase domain-containing protein [Planctomycetales bacterium]